MFQHPRILAIEYLCKHLWLYYDMIFYCKDNLLLEVPKTVRERTTPTIVSACGNTVFGTFLGNSINLLWYASFHIAC